MIKISKSLICGLTVGVLMSSIAISAYAISGDELYKNAYNAVRCAESTKTQKSINDARQAISNLYGTPAQWAIGEFSSKVDVIQHPILVSVINAISNADRTEKQADINFARKTIDKDLPTQWKNSYSSALDTVQQKLLDKAFSLYKNAELNKNKTLINDALVKVKEIETAKDPNVVTWAKNIEVNLNDFLKKNSTEVKSNTDLNLKYAVYGSEEYCNNNYSVNSMGTLELGSQEESDLMEGGLIIDTTEPSCHVLFKLENSGEAPANETIVNFKFNNMAIDFQSDNNKWQGIEYIHALGLCTEIKFTENDPIYKDIPIKFSLNFGKAVVFKNANIEVTIASKNGKVKNFKIPVVVNKF